MITTFLPRFLALVDTLQAHPRVRVTHVFTGAPATEAQLDELAEAWGCAVPGALRALYRQANGVQLRWVDVGDETYDPARDDRPSFDGPWWRLLDEPGSFAGYLDVPPLDELAGRDTIASMFGFAREEHLHRAVPFDSFEESQDAVIVFGDGRDDPWIAMSSDNLADIDLPGERTLSGYLEHVLSTWASVDHRTKQGPRALDGLLRQRVAIDPDRIVGQRMTYLDAGRGLSLMHGVVLAETTLGQPPPGWHAEPRVATVRDDLGETVYVPRRALFPTDQADDYERLYADASALRALLRGPAEPLFAALSLVTLMTHRDGLVGGPTICNHAWPHAALTSRLPPADAAQALLVAVETLRAHRETNTGHPVVWPRTRPPVQRASTTTMGELAAALFDAAALHVGRTAPDDLAEWLGPDATARLVRLLRALHARNPLHGYDPLTDRLTTAAFFFEALQGGPTALNTTALASRWGGELGLAHHRVVGA